VLVAAFSGWWWSSMSWSSWKLARRPQGAEAVREASKKARLDVVESQLRDQERSPEVGTHLSGKT